MSLLKNKIQDGTPCAEVYQGQHCKGYRKQWQELGGAGTVKGEGRKKGRAGDTLGVVPG